jgi:hypothetical protein
MNKKLLASVAAAYLLASRAALAMDIQQFEMMAEADQQAYISDLVWGAAILLEQDCMPQVAVQLRKLFIHELSPENFDPLEGTQSLGDRLLLAGTRASEHPEQASRIRVDDALRATLREKGITLPDRFAAIDRAFKPKGPPLAQKPADDVGFGSATRIDGIEGTYNALIAIEFLQLAFDERNQSEIIADKRMQGVCQNTTGRPQPSDPLADLTPSVAGYQPSWIGHTMVVRGTVSRFVQRSVNGEPYVYLYFKESPDSTVVACSRDDYWLLGVLGIDDFQSVVGKTLEFNGEVVSGTCTEQGAGLWIWQRNQARIVGSSTR